MLVKVSRLTFLLASLCAPAASVGAAEPPGVAASSLAIGVRTGEHPTFDRVVFDAPKGTTYKLERKDGTLAVQFSVAAKITVPPDKLTKVSGIKITDGADGRAPLRVQLNIAPQASVKDFYSGASIVLDISGPAAPATAQADPQKAPEKAAPPVTPAADKKPEEAPKAKEAASEPVKQPEKEPEKPPVKEAEKAPEKAPEKSEEKPAADKAEEKQKESTAKEEGGAPKPTAQSFDAAVQASAAREASSGPAPEPSTIAPTPKAAPVPVVHESSDLPPAPMPQLKRPTIVPALDPKTAAAIMAIVNEPTPAPVATFDPKASVGAAIFVRGGFGTILFDRKISPSPLLGSAPQRVKVESFDLPRSTGFRIALPPGVEMRATRNDTAWELYLVKSGSGATISTEFVSQPEFALGARLLLATASPPDPIFYTDQTVGDDLIVVPLRETGAFTIPRKLADFQIVPASQGLVIKPLHEKVVARVVPDGIEITSEGGLKLSPTRDTGIKKASADKGQLKSLFDFPRWRGAGSFSEVRQRLMQTVIELPEEERILARLDLARFYFARGMGEEALALLDMIQKSLPEIEKQTDFVALRGAVRVLAGQAEQALADLSSAALATQPEAMLWQAIADAEIRDWVPAAERFALTFPLLVNYPEPIRSRFMVLAVESALAAGKDQNAAEWLSKLENGVHDETQNPAIRYLRGALYSKAGRADMADKMWREATKGRDRLYKIRAELALVDLGVATRSLSPKQAIDRLEGLRFAWRGDDLEIDILRRLGGFYFDAKQYRTGLNVLGQALRLYPTSPQAPMIKAEMQKVFKDIFMTQTGKDMSPIESLSLYSDFRYLIPPGEEGNNVRSNLAERLVDIDLLDPACALLDDIIKNSATAEEKAQIATRIAGVRLLDHKAEAAMAVLDQSQADAANLPAAQQEERQLLRVRAMSEMGRYQDAMAALPSGGSEKTRILRADIALRAKQWQDASRALMDLVGPAKAGEVLSEEKADWLVHAAVAMAQAGDTAGLDRLAAEYGPGMTKSRKADLFKVLTRPESAGQLKDIVAAQAKITEVDIFRSVLDTYRTAKP